MLDCAPVTSTAFTHPEDGTLGRMIVTTRNGTVEVPKEFNAYKPSGDNDMHACMRPLGYGHGFHLICLYIPPSN
jgi:hypothetical protein